MDVLVTAVPALAGATLGQYRERDVEQVLDRVAPDARPVPVAAFQSSV